MSAKSRSTMPNRLYVAGYCGLEVAEPFPSNTIYDGIAEVHLQSYHLFGRHKYKKGRIWIKHPNDILGFVCGQLLMADHSLLIVPNSDLFLACCRFEHCLKTYNLSFARGSVKPKLASQADYGEVLSSFFVRTGSTTALKVENKQRKISLAILDLCNFGCKSLVEYLEMVGELEKYEAAKHERELSSREKAAISLDIANSFIDALLRVNADKQLGGIRFTIGGMASRSFKSACGELWPEEHTDEGATNLERLCYTGARIESFGSGHVDGPIYHVDVSSQFPYHASEHEHPERLLETIIGPHVTDARCERAGHCIFARCFVDCDKQYYPVRKGTRTLFATGRFWTYLCGEDFRWALRNGHIKRISIMSIYKTSRWAKPFFELALSWREGYESSGDKRAAAICKLLANTCIGRTAQLGTVWEPEHKIVPSCQYGFFSSLSPGEQTEHDYRVINWEVEKRVYGIELAGTFPAFAASVVSSARQQTCQLLDIAGRGNVFSVCGDGLLLNQAGYNNLRPYISGGRREPGKLYLAGVSSGMEHISATAYRSDCRRRASGEIASFAAKPADLMQAIAEDSEWDGSQTEKTRVVLRRCITSSLEGQFDEMANRPFAWHPTPYLEESELPPQQWSLMPSDTPTRKGKRLKAFP